MTIESSEDTLNIDLTRNQFEDLVRCVYLAHWMINGIRPEDEKVRRYEDLEQYVYALAHKHGYPDLVEFLKERNKFFFKDEFSESNEADGYRREYDDEMFWTELIQRLATRDLLEQYGVESLSKMNTREEVEKKQPILRKYIDELEQNGVQNLKLQK